MINNKNSINCLTWDEFNVDSNVSLANRASPGGGTWTVTHGAFTVDSATNRVTATSLTSTEAIAYVNFAGERHQTARIVSVKASVTVPMTTNAAPALVSRWTSNSGFLNGRLDRLADGSINATINVRSSSSSYSTVSTVNIGTFSDTHVFNINLVTVSGNNTVSMPGSVYMYLDGKLVIKITGSAVTPALRGLLDTAGFCGIAYRASNTTGAPSFDDFQAFYSPRSVLSFSESFSDDVGTELVNDLGWEFYTDNPENNIESQAVIETVGKLTINKGPGTPPSTDYARYLKEVDSPDMWAEATIYSSADVGFWPIQVRALKDSTFAVGIFKSATGSYSFGYNGVSWGTSTIGSGTYRIRVEVRGNRFYGMYRSGDSEGATWSYFGGSANEVGHALPQSVIDENPGVLTSKYVAIGYSSNVQHSNAIGNFSAGRMSEMITTDGGEVKSFSSTIGRIADTTLEDTEFSHPVWHEAFDNSNEVSIIEKGFVKKSGSGYGYSRDASGAMPGGLGYFNGLPSVTANFAAKRNLLSSSDLSANAWVASAASKGGYSNVVEFFDGYKDGVKATLSATASSRIYAPTQVNVSFNRMYTFSVYLATESGTASVKLGYGTAASTVLSYSEVFTVTTEPTRFTYTVMASSSSSFYASISSGDISLTQRFVVWGAQVEEGSYASELKYAYASGTTGRPSLWTKDVGTETQYIECDLPADPVGSVYAFIMPIALRAVNSAKFIGITLRGAGLKDVSLYSPNYINPTTIATIPSFPCRIRAEMIGNQLQLFYGEVGKLNPSTPLGATFVIDQPMYPEFETSTDVGFGVSLLETHPSVTTSLYDIVDNYEAGEVIGYYRSSVQPIKAVSSTHADRGRLPPPNDENGVVEWFENFTDDNNVSVAAIGFKKESLYHYIYALNNTTVLVNHIGAYSDNNVYPSRVTSASLMTGNAPFGGASTGISTEPAFDGSTTNRTITFVEGVESGIRQNLTSTTKPSGVTDLTVSCWMWTTEGTVDVRFTNNINTTQNVVYSDNITVTTTPTRHYATIPNTGTPNAICIVNGTGANGGTIIARGFQAEYGSTMTELRGLENVGSEYMTAGVWSNEVSSPDHYIEFDLPRIHDTNISARPSFIPGMLRVIDAYRYIGIQFESNSLRVMNLISPTGIISTIGSWTGSSMRMRLEIRGNKVWVWTGPIGVRNPTNLICPPIEIDADIYDGFMTATKTGFGSKSSTSITLNNYMDNFESGLLFDFTRIVPETGVSKSIANTAFESTGVYGPVKVDNFTNLNGVNKSITLNGYEKLGGGAAAIVSGNRLAVGNSGGWDFTTNYLPSIRNIYQSSSWGASAGAVKVGYDEETMMEDGTYSATEISFSDSPLATVRCSLGVRSTNSFYFRGSVVAYTKSGPGSIRLGFGINNSSGLDFTSLSDPVISTDIAIDETPRRIHFVVPIKINASTGTNTFFIYNNSAGTAQNVMIWAPDVRVQTAAIEDYDFMDKITDISEIAPTAWVTNVGESNQYVEFDVQNTLPDRTNVLGVGAVLRATTNKSFIGVLLTGSDYLDVAVFIPGVLDDTVIGKIPSRNVRVRAEIIGNILYVYYGQIGVKYPNEYLGQITLDLASKPELFTATKVGFGAKTLTTSSGSMVSTPFTNYEFGDVHDNSVVLQIPTSVSHTTADFARTQPDDTDFDQVVWWDNFAAPDINKSLVDLGYDKRSTYGYASPQTGVSGDDTNGTLVVQTYTAGSTFNRYFRSNSLYNSTLVGGATKSTSSAVEFFDGVTTAPSITFVEGVLSGVSMGLIENIPAGTAVTVSAWVVALDQPTTVRLAVSGTSTRSEDFEIGLEPIRISFTTTTPSVSSVWSIVNGSELNGGAVVIHGAQFTRSSVLTEVVASETDIAYKTDGLWVKNASSHNHYVECDLVKSPEINAGSVNYIPLVVRAVNAHKYIGVMLSGNDGRTVTLYSPAGMSINVGRLPEYPCRLRIDAYEGSINLWVGDYGKRHPDILWFSRKIDPNLYPEVMTASDTGLGFQLISISNNKTFSGISDSYESGKIILPRMSIDVDRAVSITKADPAKLMPSNTYNSKVDWYENYNGYTGETSLVDVGFEKLSGSGIAITNGNGMVSHREYQHRPTIEDSPAMYNRIANSVRWDVWTRSGGATHDGMTTAVEFFDGTRNGNKITFKEGVENSGIRYRSNFDSSDYGIELVFSAWLATEIGTTTVRLVITDSSGIPLLSSQDIEVTQVPTRHSFSFKNPSSSRRVSYGIYAGSNKNGGTIVGWGAQVNDGLSLKELVITEVSQNSYLGHGVWALPVSHPDQYVECDVYKTGTASNSSSQILPIMLRVVNSTKFISVMMSYTTGERQDIFIFTSTGELFHLGTINKNEIPFRIRVEARGNKIYAFYGPVGRRDPKYRINRTPLALPENLYPEFMSATKTGIGTYKGASGRNVSSSNVTDEYESGAVVGVPSVYAEIVKAKSSTTADTVLPLDLIWYEWFDAPAGTPLVDLGFEYKTDEETGEPRNAVVSSNHRLSLLSSNNAPASWTKSLGDFSSQYIQADLHRVPYDNQYFIALRATDQNNFIGMRHDMATGRLVLAYKVDGNEHVIYSAVTPELPVAVRIQVISNQIKAFIGPAGGVSGSRPTRAFGNANGYLFDIEANPLLMTGKNSGVARSNSTASIDLLDNYYSGFVIVPKVYVVPNNAKSITRAKLVPVSMANNPAPFIARSITEADESDLSIIPPISLDALMAASNSGSGIGEMSQENYPQPKAAKSVTFGKIPFVHQTVYIDPKPGVSITEAGIVNEGYVYITVDRAFSETVADYMIVKMANNVTPLDARSITLAEKPDLDVYQGITVTDARSVTYAHKPTVIMNPHLDVFDAYSITLADATEINVQTYKMKPWLFN